MTYLGCKSSSNHHVNAFRVQLGHVLLKYPYLDTIAPSFLELRQLLIYLLFCLTTEPSKWFHRGFDVYFQISEELLLGLLLLFCWLSTRWVNLTGKTTTRWHSDTVRVICKAVAISKPLALKLDMMIERSYWALSLLHKHSLVILKWRGQEQTVLLDN